ALQIRPDAKVRPQGALWIIFLGVAVITAGGIYFAITGKEDGRRLAAGGKTAAANATTPRPSTNGAAASGSPGDSVLTVSGYIVNRERIELSPRFMGLVKWI